MPYYGLGADGDGRPYYAMRFVRGQSLKEAIDEFFDPAEQNRNRSDKTLQFRMLLRRFVDVCNAIEYAHSRGVVHRDLKPGNVMLGKYGETLVVDWGLAKAVGKAESSVSDESQIESGSGSGVTPTRHGAAIGTPAFMSPEQAAGTQDEVGPSTDVYGLGATLYYLLTGNAPFSDADGDLLSNVQRGRFVSPRKRVSWVPRPLEAICLRAMSLQPTRRYADPASVAKDISAGWPTNPSQHIKKQEPSVPRAGRAAIAPGRARAPQRLRWLPLWQSGLLSMSEELPKTVAGCYTTLVSVRLIWLGATVMSDECLSYSISTQEMRTCIVSSGTTCGIYAIAVRPLPLRIFPGALCAQP